MFSISIFRYLKVVRAKYIMDVLQLEGFGSDIKNSVSLVLCDSVTQLWLPYEFMSCEPATRLFLYGEHTAGTRGLIAAEGWSMSLCMIGPVGARSWSLLASMMRHMVGPVLLVVAPDVMIPAAFLPHIGGNTTTVVFRWLSEVSTLGGLPVTSVFFPLAIQATQITAVQRALWKGKALRTSDTNLNLVVQETRPQGLCLVSTVLEDEVVSLSWYRQLDSDQLVVDERRNLLALWLGAISERIIQLMKKE